MEKLLVDNSTSKYFIEYAGFMSNHLAHGVIALHRLGASEGRLNQFMQRYTQKLDSKDKYLEDVESIKDNQGIVELLGKRQKYYVLLNHYQRLLKSDYKDSLDDLLKKEFPKLSLGMVCSALHGLIHTGYGYSVRSPQIVCEGLAYLHHSYLPLKATSEAPQLAILGSGNMDILDVINMFCKDDDLYDRMVEESKRDDAAVKSHGYFQPRAATLMLNHADELLCFINQIKFPDNFNPNEKTMKQIGNLLKWVVDCAIMVYVAAETPNDFFLIHGVTAAWSLLNIVSTITNYDQALESIRTYLCVLFAAYFAEGRPRILAEKLSSEQVDLSEDWCSIVQRAMDKETDVHIYKLVQVCHDMNSSNTDPLMTRVYKMASLTALKHELYFARQSHNFY